MTHTASVHGYSDNQNSFLDRLTKKERFWGFVGIFFLITSIGSDGAPVLSLIIFLLIAHSVSKRESTKSRINHLLDLQPDTTVGFIASQIGESEDYVTKVLKIMILDEGAMIRFDLVNKTVKKVDPVKKSERQAESTTSTSQPTVSVQQVHQPEQTTIETSEEVNNTEAPQTKCSQCSVKLPLIAKYCHDCGVRQF